MDCPTIPSTGHLTTALQHTSDVVRHPDQVSYPLAPGVPVSIVNAPPNVPSPAVDCNETSTSNSGGVVRIDTLVASHPHIVLGEFICQEYESEYGLEYMVDGDVAFTDEWSNLLLRFYSLALNNTSWFQQGKVATKRCYKNLAFSIHCYDQSFPFFECEKLRHRLFYLRKWFKDKMHLLYSNGLDHFFDTNNQWVGERDTDGVPLFVARRRPIRLPFIVESMRIASWREPILNAISSVESQENSDAPPQPAPQIIGQKRPQVAPIPPKQKSKKIKLDDEEVAMSIAMTIQDLCKNLMSTNATTTSPLLGVSAALARHVENPDPPPVPPQILDKIGSWSIDETAWWLKHRTTIPQDDVAVLRSHMVDGEAMKFFLSNDSAINDIPGITFAAKLKLRIALRSGRETPSLFSLTSPIQNDPTV